MKASSLRILAGCVLISLLAAACVPRQAAAPRPMPSLVPSPLNVKPPNGDAVIVLVDSSIASTTDPAFYYRDPSNPSQLIAYRWDGQRVGVVAFTSVPLYGAIFPSPDGTRLLVDGVGQVTHGGQVIGHAPWPPGMWGDDSRHVCSFLSAEGTRTSAMGAHVTDAFLYETTDRGALASVVRFGGFGPRRGPGVLACAATRRLALVAQSFTVQITSTGFVDLTRGTVRPLQPSSVPAGGSLIASADGRYVAESSRNPASTGEASILIRDAATWRQVGRVSGLGAAAFSADDSRLLTASDAGGGETNYSLVDWRRGKTLWTGAGGLGTVLTRPRSGDFLIGFRTWEPAGDGRNQPFEDVVLVHADGSTESLMQHVGPLT